MGLAIPVRGEGSGVNWAAVCDTDMRRYHPLTIHRLAYNSSVHYQYKKKQLQLHYPYKGQMLTM